jgi:hypothetical protein
MALGATRDHKDSAVLVEADLKELAESLGQVLRLPPAFFRSAEKSVRSLRMTELRLGKVGFVPMNRSLEDLKAD